ncbi:MAG: acyltransferase [Methylococcales bacterium]
MKERIIKWFKKRQGIFPVNDLNCIIASDCSFAVPNNITLGKWVYIGPKSFLEAKGGIELEDGVIISSRVTILSSSHDYQGGEMMPYSGNDIKKSVCVKKGVWIGYGAIIMPGVTINEGAVVAAGAIVTKSVSPGCVVGGNPAIVISERRGEKWKELIADNIYRIKEKLHK